MNKKILLIIILIITIIIIGIILLLNINKKYNRLVVNNNKINEIKENKVLDNNISINNIKFNDNNLLIDNKNNIIYYSVIDSYNKYNPSVKINNNLNIVFNNKINNEDDIEAIVYNKNKYKMYKLVVTNLPIINIKNKNDNLVDIELFDNHKDAFQRYLNLMAKLKIKDDEYRISLFVNSPGHNRRDNKISIFGMEKHHEYILKKANNNDIRIVKLFVNNEYIGDYSFNYNERSLNEKNR